MAIRDLRFDYDVRHMQLKQLLFLFARSCGFCAYQCPVASDVCCSGVCADLLTSAANCGQCGFLCVSLPDIQARNPKP